MTASVKENAWLNVEQDGTVTVCLNDGSTRSGTVTDFYQHLTSEVQNIYIPGGAHNAALILDVRAKLPAARIYTGSPAPLYRSGKRQPLAIQLHSLGALTPWFGGWRQVGESDLQLFRFLSFFRPDLSPRDMEAVATKHPAYPAISFLEAKPVPMLQLLAAIGDPRWFNDPGHPDRESRLRLFLGITARNLDRYLDPEKKSEGVSRGPHYDRFKLLLESLYDLNRRTLLTAMKKDKGPSRFFHYPLMSYKTSTPEFRTTALRRLEHMVSFLRHVWLHEVAPPGREVFVPKYFFGWLDKKQQHACSTAYVRHRKALPPRVSATVTQ